MPLLLEQAVQTRAERSSGVAVLTLPGDVGGDGRPGGRAAPHVIAGRTRRSPRIPMAWVARPT